MQRFIAWFTLADPRAVAQTRIADLVAHKSGISQADGIVLANFRVGQTPDALAGANV